MPGGGSFLNPSPDTTSPQLDYAPPRRWNVVRVWRKTVIAILIVASLTAALAWGWKFTWQLQRAHLQKQCLDFVLSPDQVVYTEDKTEANALLTRDPKYLRTLTGAAYQPTEAAKFFVGLPPSGMAFLHSRQAVDRPQRLVCVRVWIWHTSNTTRTVWLESTASRTIELAIPRESSESLAPGQSLPLALSLDDVLRLFAGQIDPADSSHFAIVYELNGKRGSIDGWLKSDDSVILEVRDGAMRK
jgi:hypothetical protein